jgi:hypothetical protein
MDFALRKIGSFCEVREGREPERPAPNPRSGNWKPDVVMKQEVPTLEGLAERTLKERLFHGE